MARQYNFRSGQGVWIVQLGWDSNFTQDLQKEYAEFRDIKVTSFGPNISFFKLTVGQAMPSGTASSS